MHGCTCVSVCACVCACVDVRVSARVSVVFGGGGVLKLKVTFQDAGL